MCRRSMTEFTSILHPYTFACIRDDDSDGGSSGDRGGVTAAVAIAIAATKTMSQPVLSIYLHVACMHVYTTLYVLRSICVIKCS